MKTSTQEQDGHWWATQTNLHVTLAATKRHLEHIRQDSDIMQLKAKQHWVDLETARLEADQWRICSGIVCYWDEGNQISGKTLGPVKGAW